MKAAFEPTHQIVFKPSKGGPFELWTVMVHEGKAYTEGIWNDGTEPEWTVDDEGNFQYEGALDEGSFMVVKLSQSGK